VPTTRPLKGRERGQRPEGYKPAPEWENAAPQFNAEFLLPGERQEPSAEMPPSPAGVTGAGGPAASLAGSPAPSFSEVVALGATDSLYFCKTWFPKTFRQDFAPNHRIIWDLLGDSTKRLVNIILPRDWAKTTTLRAFAAKRIAYGISRTIVYVGKSEKHARRSVRWLRLQIEVNAPFCQAFGLAKGRTWTDEELQILHGPEQHTIWVLALGITGSTRGINIDDYRPDLIVIDDVIDAENSATREQRDKVADTVLADLKDSLSPTSETPDAKMVLLNTPQDFEDITQRALKDPQFTSAKFGCWTKETAHLPIEMQESSWPVRYPSEVLRADKAAFIGRNKLSIFTREKECELITPEECAFRIEWLNFFGDGEDEPEPPRGKRWVEIAIDPVPPPSDLEIAKGLYRKNFEAFVVGCRCDGLFYILETVYNRGHQPNWTINTFFQLCIKYNPRKVLIEAVAYQKTLEWLLREAMRQRGRFWVVEPFKDPRKKSVRIVDGIAGIASAGQLYVRRNQTTLIGQFNHYPGKNPEGDDDDVLEATAVVLASLEKGSVSIMLENQYMSDDDNSKALEYERGAP
jgi:hypothetical protein